MEKNYKMKYLLLSLILCGCATERAYHEITPRIVDYGFNTIEIPNKHVTCYIYKDSDTTLMDCGRDK